MGAGDDFLTRIAALLDAEGMQAFQRQLLRRPLLALGGIQSRQAVTQVDVAPAGEGGDILGCRLVADAQQARLVRGAQVQFDRFVLHVQQRTVRSQRRAQHALDLQGGRGLDHHLPAKHEAPERGGHVRRRDIGQHQQQLVGGRAQHGEHGNDPSLGRKPCIPLPMARFQGVEIVGELRLCERHRIWPLQHEQTVVGQGKGPFTGI